MAARVRAQVARGTAFLHYAVPACLTRPAREAGGCKRVAARLRRTKQRQRASRASRGRRADASAQLLTTQQAGNRLLWITHKSTETTWGGTTTPPHVVCGLKSGEGHEIVHYAQNSQRLSRLAVAKVGGCKRHGCRLRKLSKWTPVPPQRAARPSLGMGGYALMGAKNRNRDVRIDWERILWWARMGGRRPAKRGKRSVAG